MVQADDEERAQETAEHSAVECRQHLDNDDYQRVRCAHLDNRFVVQIRGRRFTFVDYVERFQDENGNENGNEGVIVEDSSWCNDDYGQIEGEWNILVDKMRQGKPPDGNEGEFV